MLKYRQIFLGALIAAVLSVQARAAALLTELIDIPTADAVDHYGYNATFRFYTGGGVLSKTAFGVFPRLNIGFGLDMEELIGSDTVDVNRPTLNVKFRFFDGTRQLPALALGYDGQGYFFNEKTDEYIQREKGLYLVGSGEIIAPDLTLHGGANVYDFSNDRVYFFTGLSYLIEQVVGVMVEADIEADVEAQTPERDRDTRLNAGLRYYVTPSFAVDLAARDLGAAGRKAERIVRIGYFGSF
jgi:hypothetical protein